MVGKKRGDFRPFTKSDSFYLFAGNKVALFKVSEAVYETSKWWESDRSIRKLNELYSIYSVEEVEKAIQKLKSMADISEPGDCSSDDSDLHLKEMHLQISHDCNLDCKYCYAGGGSFGGPSQKMDQAVAERSIDFFLEKLKPGVVGDLSFDGGEPLMNWGLIEHCVKYAEEQIKGSNRKLAFNISTNGTLLNRQKLEFVEKHRIGLGVSIDGDEKSHDCNRVLKGGGGSYKYVEDNIKALSQRAKLFQLQGRGTITRDNLNCFDTVKHLLDIGFRHIYLEPVSGDCEPWILTDGELRVIKNQFSLLADMYIKMILDGKFFILRNFYIFLKRIHKRNKMVYKCGVGRSGVAVTPNGDIFPCYKFASVPDYKMGNVTDSCIDEDIYKKFVEQRVDERVECRECWAGYICGGSCLYLSVFKHEDIRINDKQECDFIRHMADLSLKIYAGVMNEDAGLWSKLLV